MRAVVTLQEGETIALGCYQSTVHEIVRAARDAGRRGIQAKVVEAGISDHSPAVTTALLAALKCVKAVITIEGITSAFVVAHGVPEIKSGEAGAGIRSNARDPDGGMRRRQIAVGCVSAYLRFDAASSPGWRTQKNADFMPINR